MMECIQVTTTVETRKDADNLIRLVLEERLAACIQVSPCSSNYRWQGVVEQADELKLVMKSFHKLYPKLEKLILDNHPYDTPEILATPVQYCNSSYLEWMDDELKTR